jgi:hypothetical protein
VHSLPWTRTCGKAKWFHETQRPTQQSRIQPDRTSSCRRKWIGSEQGAHRPRVTLLVDSLGVKIVSDDGSCSDTWSWIRRRAINRRASRREDLGCLGCPDTVGRIQGYEC